MSPQHHGVKTKEHRPNWLGDGRIKDAALHWGGLSAAWVGVGLLVQYFGLKIMAACRNMRQPEFVLLYMLTPKHLTWRLFPTRQSKAAQRPRHLRKARRRFRISRRFPLHEHGAAPLAANASQSLTQYLKSTSTKAMVIVHEGKLAGTFGATHRRYTAWSVSKSIVSLVIGRLIADGTLRPDATVSEILPAFKHQGQFDDVTVAQLLDMSSGIQMQEHYGIRQRYSEVQGMYLAKSLLSYVQHHDDTFAAPGQVSRYRSVDAQLLGIIAEAASGERLATLVERYVWQPAGAAKSARWTLERRGGREQAFCGCAATTEDLARVGQWLLDGDTGLGRWNFRIAHARRVVRQGVEARPIEPLEPGWHYSALWWQPPGSDARGDYCARGWRGQYLWVDPRTQTVIAVAANHADGEHPEQDIAVFRQIADALQKRSR